MDKDSETIDETDLHGLESDDEMEYADESWSCCSTQIRENVFLRLRREQNKVWPSIHHSIT